MFLDIDSLLRPVYGHDKQGASFGHAKIAGRALLRKGLSPLITTLSTAAAAPVIAEAWLRGGKTGSGRGAARQLKQAITTARAIDPDATIMARGDSAFGTKKVIGACLDERIEFSLTLSRNTPGHHGDRGHRRRRLDRGALPGRGATTPTPAR